MSDSYLGYQTLIPTSIFSHNKINKNHELQACMYACYPLFKCTTDIINTAALFEWNLAHNKAICRLRIIHSCSSWVASCHRGMEVPMHCTVLNEQYSERMKCYYKILNHTCSTTNGNRTGHIYLSILHKTLCIYHTLVSHIKRSKAR